jgi:hypothetical protein
MTKMRNFDLKNGSTVRISTFEKKDTARVKIRNVG